MTMAMNSNPAGGGGCGGDGCGVRDPWPLLQLRHNGIFCRLCSSCVLKYNSGSFCALCFALLGDGSPSPSPPVIKCSKCRSVTCHVRCLPNPDLASRFVCPNCKNPEGFSYFPKEDGAGGKRIVDAEAAKVLLAAANLAADSMRRAAAAAKAEAEKKAKEAAVARKRAREVLEKAMSVCANEKARNAAAVTPKVAVAADEPKKKMAKVNAGSGEQKRGQLREVEKWMRFHEPIPIPENQGEGEKDKAKGGAAVEVKSRVPSGLGQEEKKGGFLSAQSGGFKGEERNLVGGANKGRILSQSTQGEESFLLCLLSFANFRLTRL